MSEIRQYSQLQEGTMITDDSVCSICAQTLNNREKFVGKCNHSFHLECMGTYKKAKSTVSCPLCRGEIQFKTLESQNIGASSSEQGTFFMEFFGTGNSSNWYVLGGSLYQLLVIPMTFFNASALFVGLVGLCKFKYDEFIFAYFLVSVILGTIQCFANIRVREVLDSHQNSERFGKEEIKNLQKIWLVIYVSMFSAGCVLIAYDQSVSELEKQQLDYFRVVFISNLFRMVISILKTIFYVFEIYETFTRHNIEFYTFMSIHS